MKKGQVRITSTGREVYGPILIIFKPRGVETIACIGTVADAVIGHLMSFMLGCCHAGLEIFPRDFVLSIVCLIATW
jgi:hypothetical protein